MIQINPREVAAEAMVQILAEGAYNNTALRRLLRQNGAMSQQDRAFVTEIVNGITAEYLLCGLCHRPVFQYEIK